MSKTVVHLKPFQFKKGQLAWNKRVPHPEGLLWCSKGQHWCPPGTEFERTSWCKACARLYHAERRPLYRDAKNKASRGARVRLRAEVLAHYGTNGVPMCQCCGERTLEFLGIDHIEGGGCKHKKEIHAHLYKWLKDHGFPEGFRDLCHNCNQSLGAYGYCPHKSS